MPALALTQKSGASFGNTGKAYRFPQNASLAADYTEIPLPPGVNATNTRPALAPMNFSGKSRMYVVGGHTDNLVVDEHFRLLRQGILPPTTRPTIAASGTGITGSAVGRISFWDDTGKRRSPLSAASNTLALVNQGRAWSGLPTSAPDEETYPAGTTTVNASTTLNGSGTTFTEEVKVGDRIAVSSAASTYAVVLAVVSDTQLTLNVALGNGSSQTMAILRHAGITHVELWVSMDGGLYRLAQRVDLGVSSVTENVATLALGEAFTQTFSKFPRCKVNTIYHSRQWMAGDSQYPNRIYYSLVNDPGNMEGYLETRDGSAVVALFEVRDILFVGCERTIQRVQGYTSTDFQVDIAEPAIGVFSHHGIKIIHGYGFIPTYRGMYLCTGAFHFISGHYEVTWRDELAIRTAGYQDSFAVDEPTDNVYKLHVGAHTLGEGASSVYWVLDYRDLLPQTGGNFSPPEISLDCFNTSHKTGFEIGLPGSAYKFQLVGTCTGKLYRQESASTTTALDDAGDTFGRRVILDSGVYFMGDPGGDDGDGKTWQKFWFYVQSELNAWVWQIRTGDEQCRLLQTPVKSRTEALSRETVGLGNPLVPKTVHPYTFNILGRGIQFKVYVDAPQLGWAFRGFGGTYGPGRNYRGEQPK